MRIVATRNSGHTHLYLNKGWMVCRNVTLLRKNREGTRKREKERGGDGEEREGRGEGREGEERE